MSGIGVALSGLETTPRDWRAYPHVAKSLVTICVCRPYGLVVDCMRRIRECWIRSVLATDTPV